MWVNYPKISKKILNIVFLFFIPDELIINIKISVNLPGALFLLTSKY